MVVLVLVIGVVVVVVVVVVFVGVVLVVNGVVVVRKRDRVVMRKLVLGGLDEVTGVRVDCLRVKGRKGFLCSVFGVTVDDLISL